MKACEVSILIAFINLAQYPRLKFSMRQLECLNCGLNSTMIRQHFKFFYFFLVF